MNYEYNLKLFKKGVFTPNIEFNIKKDLLKKEPILQALFKQNDSVSLYFEPCVLDEFKEKVEKIDKTLETFINLIKEDINILHLICQTTRATVYRSKFINEDIMVALLYYINIFEGYKLTLCDVDMLLGKGVILSFDGAFRCTRLINKLKEIFCKNKVENDMKEFKGVVDVNEEIKKQDICNNLQVECKGGTTSDQEVFIKEFVNKLFEEYGIKLGKVEILIYDHYKNIEDKEFKKITIASKNTFKEFIKTFNYTMDKLQDIINNLTFINDREKESYEILAMFIVFQPGDIKITRNKSHILVPMLNLPQYNSHQIYLKIDFYSLQKLLNFESIEYLRSIIPVKENLEEDYIINLY